MIMRRFFRLAPPGLVLALALMPTIASAETCAADSFGDAVDASAAELRAFSAETQPKLKAKLQALRDHMRWTDPDFETKGLKLVHDAKLDGFDAQAGELLSKIDTLGSPEAGDTTADTNCANLSDLKAASSELMAVMRAKSAYLIAKIDAEIAKAPAAAPTVVAKTEPPQPAPPKDAPAATPPPAPEPASPPAVAETEKAAPADPALSLSPVRKTETPKKETTPPSAQPNAPAEPHAASPPAPKSDSKDAAGESSWSTTTAQAVIPPPHGEPPAAQPDYNAAPPGTPYELPPPAGEDGETTFDAEGGGYTIDEIREATRGFFGTISTSLASVIEHAFQKGGRPTAYVLGNEGGGAFLAGLRYGEGTMYLRDGGSQKVYWHGPSIGYDLGAEGSRTLFLIYDLHEPNGIFRRFTGVDGSAYLVGGVGMTFLKGGPVTMAPIRSGLGLRLGASIGYVRFSPRPTWNPF